MNLIFIWINSCFDKIFMSGIVKIHTLFKKNQCIYKNEFGVYFLEEGIRRCWMFFFFQLNQRFSVGCNKMEPHVRQYVTHSHSFNDIYWPPSSSDLTPLEFFLYDYLKKRNCRQTSDGSAGTREHQTCNYWNRAAFIWKDYRKTS